MPALLRKPSFVLDTSVSAAWVLNKQSTPYKHAVLTALDTQTALVPALWHTEMSSILCKFAKQNQGDIAALEIHLSHLDALSIQTDEWLATRVQRQKMGSMRTLTQAAMLHGLTSYDAQYLMLALRTGLPLASCDEQLCASALEAGIAIYQP
jgi:predicted nucleic acid-binding protein